MDCNAGLTFAVTRYETYASFVSASSFTGSFTLVMRYPSHFGSCGPRPSSLSDVLCLKPGPEAAVEVPSYVVGTAGDSQVTLSKTSSSSPSMSQCNLDRWRMQGRAANDRSSEVRDRLACLLLAWRRARTSVRPRVRSRQCFTSRSYSRVFWSTIVNTLLPLSPTAMVRRWSWLPFCSLLLSVCCTTAYEVPIADTDYERQVCSGMWGGKNTYINGETNPRLYTRLTTLICQKLRSMLAHMASWRPSYMSGGTSSTLVRLPRTLMRIVL